MKEDILRRISEEEKKLNDLDTDGHIWWNRFREFIEAIPEKEKHEEPEDLNIDFRSLGAPEDKYKFTEKRMKVTKKKA